MSKLTFVIPTYKPDLDIFTKCLKSLAEQSLKEWEAIVVLDGPNEDAARIAAKVFKKVPNRFRIIEIPHGGAQKARNAGRELVKSPYVVFWDSDCAIEPHTAQAWVNIFDKEPEVGFIYSGYKFFDEKGAINAEPWDPWLLKVTNFISACFPVRTELAPKWDEELESLQDWSFWLRVAATGAKGKFLQGYAFSTAYPTPESISGKGCTSENWLKRMDAVRELHGIPKKEVCVTSLSNKMDGIALAKLIDADYHDRPNDKPSHYKTIIQLGFSLNPGIAELHAQAWGPDHKKVLFFTREDVDEIYNAVSLNALDEYSKRFNEAYTMLCEDKAAQRILERAGFKVSIMALPMVNKDEPAPLPERPKFLIDASERYGHVMGTLKRALPDMDIEVANGITPIDKVTGLVHFYVDRAMSSGIKRFLLNGRHVVSNVQQPFAGFLEDKVTDEKFIVAMVERLRKIAKTGPNKAGMDYYKKSLGAEKLQEILK